MPKPPSRLGSVGVRGERHPLAKLTDDQVKEIRRLAGHVPDEDLAARFGVSRTTINKAKLRHTWHHVR